MDNSTAPLEKELGDRDFDDFTNDLLDVTLLGVEVGVDEGAKAMNALGLLS